MAGKTMFLTLIFYLRVAAGLPTLYMSFDEYATVYKDDKLWRVQPKEFLEFLPNETWCLVDCNSSFQTIPGILLHSQRYIVQAASPRNGRMHWAKKTHVGAQYCLMKP
ncbi:hypothetical protein C8R44DRAFT_764336 [Mycena epipterygia]|nr:hypothetical protein C8R44DRAFT_764336 [Mycena epipterygia]